MIIIKPLKQLLLCLRCGDIRYRIGVMRLNLNDCSGRYLFNVIAAVIILWSGVGSGAFAGEAGRKIEDGAALRHSYTVTTGIPASYRFVRNPLSPTKKIVALGRQLYVEHCVSCHGAFGLGDGDLAGDLDVRPTNISYVQLTATSVEGFVYWSIHDGGEPIKSPMPAYKDVLTPDEIWSVIHFMRKGFR